MAAQQQNNSRFCVWGVGEGRGDEAGSASGLNGTFQTSSGGPRHLLLSLPGAPEPEVQPLGPPMSSAAPDLSQGGDSPTPWSLSSPPPRPLQSQGCGGRARPTPARDVKSSPVRPTLPGIPPGMRPGGQQAGSEPAQVTGRGAQGRGRSKKWPAHLRRSSA